MGLDVLWGYDRRPVSMALLRAKDGQELAFSFGVVKTAERKTTTTYRQLSYYLFLLHSSQHSHTGRQTDRDTQHTNNPYDMGSFYGQRGRGHGNAHFFLVWFISWGSTHHTSYPFSLVMAAHR